jgi:hypothetical protein
MTMFSIWELSFASCRPSVFQDALVRDGRRNALQLGQRATAAGQPLEDGRRAKARRVQLIERGERWHERARMRMGLRGCDVYRKRDSLCLSVGGFGSTQKTEHVDGKTRPR